MIFASGLKVPFSVNDPHESLPIPITFPFSETLRHQVEIGSQSLVL